MVKSLNQLGCHELEEHRRPKAAADLALEPDGSPYAVVYTADQLRERISRR